MIIKVKFNERTSDENQMFVLDMNKHYQIFIIEVDRDLKINKDL